jgi:hypothetical protein
MSELPCDFCEEARRRLAKLSGVIDAWTRSKIGVDPHLAILIDRYFAEQYRKVSEEDGDHHNNDA